jgi:hypothetical protein
MHGLLDVCSRACDSGRTPYAVHRTTPYTVHRTPCREHGGGGGGQAGRGGSSARPTNPGDVRQVQACIEHTTPHHITPHRITSRTREMSDATSPSSSSSGRSGAVVSATSSRTWCDGAKGSAREREGCEQDKMGWDREERADSRHACDHGSRALGYGPSCGRGWAGTEHPGYAGTDGLCPAARPAHSKEGSPLTASPIASQQTVRASFAMPGRTLFSAELGLRSVAATISATCSRLTCAPHSAGGGTRARSGERLAPRFHGTQNMGQVHTAAIPEPTC